ncbi:MAG: glycosyltransferase family 4 protein [bacterium]|nr:glycosyltransferase family 4 protein [bacterium]
MRICIDISQTVYEGTGSGRYVIELVNELLSQDLTNDYLLFGSAMQRFPELEQVISRIKSRGADTPFSTKLFRFPPKLYEILWNSLHIIPIESWIGEIDVYHSSDWVEAPSKAKRVTTVHDLIPFLYPEYVHPRIVAAHTHRWEIIRREIDSIIVDADVTKKDIIARFNIPESKITVIPLGCDSRFFSIGKLNTEDSLSSNAQSIQTLQTFGLTGRSYILSVGTLEPRKNISRLIEAYSLLDNDIKTKYPLVIVGKKAWIGEFDLPKGVIFTGYVDDIDLPYLYGNAKCFVMPSLYEGFGLPVLEAMASGTPVICSNRSSLPEIGGDDVHYIENPEEIESIRLVLYHVLTSDSQELAMVAKSAYTRAMGYSWQRTAHETLNVYSKLFKG